MKTRLAVVGMLVLVLAVGYTVRGGLKSVTAQSGVVRPDSGPHPPEVNLDDPSGAKIRDPSKFPRMKTTFTLQRARDFHYFGGNLDCPKCKDGFVARIAPPAPGARIITVTWLARRPVANNHWYRCGVEAKCGVPEFGDPADPRLNCDGKTACNVYRATDDGVGNYEDDILMDWQ